MPPDDVPATDDAPGPPPDPAAIGPAAIDPVAGLAGPGQPATGDPHAHAPDPTVVLGRVVVPVDLTSVRARLVLDGARGGGRGEAEVDFATGPAAGSPVLDLRQPIEVARLDGRLVPAGSHDLGGGPRSHMVVLDAELAPATLHRLELAYPLTTPDAGEALPVGWSAEQPGRVRFDLWMSDLHPGRYLEQWVPANLVHDRFALEVELAVTGARVDHVVVTNGTATEWGPHRWRVTWPATSTALSPMLVVAPADEVTIRQAPGLVTAVPVEALRAGVDPAAVEEEVGLLVTENGARFGPFAHGTTFTTWVWASTRGMEYDGATTCSLAAVEHEVFHSWFGRGVKPATANDGWIDEGVTTWWTGRPPRGRRWAEPFDPAEPPVVLHPSSPWSRHTPTASYTVGARFFAGLADRCGGVDQLVEALAAFYRTHSGRLVTTAALQAHLSEASASDLGPAFARWVHGRDVPAR